MFQRIQEGNCGTEAGGAERHHGRDEGTGAHDVSDDEVYDGVMKEVETHRELWMPCHKIRLASPLWSKLNGNLKFCRFSL